MLNYVVHYQGLKLFTVAIIYYVNQLHHHYPERATVIGISDLYFFVVFDSQNQAMVQPSASKPSTSRGPENPENHQSGGSSIAYIFS